MARQILDWRSIGLLADGLFGRQIDQELLRVYSDVDDRGQDGLPRKVTIELTFHPEAKGVTNIDPKVAAKLPPQRGYMTQAKLDRTVGGMLFNPSCAANPDQTTFQDMDGK